jgi:cell wall assembly regulator SMI1
MLDLDPPPEGTYGQVIESISDEVVNRWVAKSFVDYLESFAAALEAGIYVFWESSREKGIVSVESLEWR